MSCYIMQNFDPVKHILEQIPSEEADLQYFEKEVRHNQEPLLFLIHSLDATVYFS